MRGAIFKRPADCAFDLGIGLARQAGKLGKFLRVRLDSIDHTVGPPVAPLWIDQDDRVIAARQCPAGLQCLRIDHTLVVIGNQDDIDLRQDRRNLADDFPGCERSVVPVAVAVDSHHLPPVGNITSLARG